MDTIQKLLALLSLHRISPNVKSHLRREQAGFRPNCSCVDRISTIRMVIEQSIERYNSIFLLFIRQEAIWNALAKIGIPESIIDLIRELYHDASCKMRFKGNHSIPFNKNRGVRYECVLSPLLFITTLDLVVTRTNTDASRGTQWSR